MNTVPEKKDFLKKEITRVSKLLNKQHQVNFTISWNRKRKNNLIQTKDIDQLKEKGQCRLIGIVYFTITGKETLFMGQTMLLLDMKGKEICCTSFFIKKNRVLELSYAWEDGMKLLSMSIRECIDDEQHFLTTRM
ncbi:MAG: hypothetical protein WCP92_04260 [bacterium]